MHQFFQSFYYNVIPKCLDQSFESLMTLLQGKGVREGEVRKKNETGTLEEQITFNEARRGSSQINELLH